VNDGDDGWEDFNVLNTTKTTASSTLHRTAKRLKREQDKNGAAAAAATMRTRDDGGGHHCGIIFTAPSTQLGSSTGPADSSQGRITSTKADRPNQSSSCDNDDDAAVMLDNSSHQSTTAATEKGTDDENKRPNNDGGSNTTTTTTSAAQGENIDKTAIGESSSSSRRKKISCSKNIVHHLLHRSTWGAAAMSKSSSMTAMAATSIVPPWKVVWQMNLFRDQEEEEEGPLVGGMRLFGQSSRRVMEVSWDPEGLGLAVATEDSVRIYNWDKVLAADMRYRNRGGSSFRTIPTVFTLQFPVSRQTASIAFLQWNPHVPGELAVGMR
jgi:hypothetical protein